MATVALTFSAVDERTLRDILAALSANRTEIADHYDWRPRVNVEGPNCYGIETDPLPVNVAADIMAVVQAAQPNVLTCG